MEVPDDNSSFSTPFVPNRVRGVPSTFGGFTPSTVPEINITPASVRGYYKDEKKDNLSGLSKNSQYNKPGGLIAGNEEDFKPKPPPSTTPSR